MCLARAAYVSVTTGVDARMRTMLNKDVTAIGSGAPAVGILFFSRSG